jgi:hypothetical protein
MNFSEARHTSGDVWYHLIKTIIWYTTDGRHVWNDMIKVLGMGVVAMEMTLHLYIDTFITVHCPLMSSFVLEYLNGIIGRHSVSSQGFGIWYYPFTDMEWQGHSWGYTLGDP